MDFSDLWTTSGPRQQRFTILPTSLGPHIFAKFGKIAKCIHEIQALKACFWNLHVFTPITKTAKQINKIKGKVEAYVTKTTCTEEKENYPIDSRLGGTGYNCSGGWGLGLKGC